MYSKFVESLQCILSFLTLEGYSLILDGWTTYTSIRTSTRLKKQRNNKH